MNTVRKVSVAYKRCRLEIGQLMVAEKLRIVWWDRLFWACICGSSDVDSFTSACNSCFFFFLRTIIL